MTNFEKNHPLVSVIMPVYNAGSFLLSTLESVSAQTYKNLEIITVDDGSNDSSLILLKEFQKKEKRLKIYHFKKNRGVGSAANFGIKKAQGEFIARMDADDLIPENRIEKQVSFLFNHPEVVVVGGQVELITEDEKPIITKKFPLTHREIINLAFMAMPIQQGAMMVNKNLLPKNFIWYKEKYKTSEDLDFFFRVFKYGLGANLPNTLLFYRQHGTSISQVENPKGIFFGAFEIRKLFWQKFQNQVSYKTKLLMAVQYLFALLLPANFIYPLYYLWRGWGIFRLQKKQKIQPLLRFALNLLV